MRIFINSTFKNKILLIGTIFLVVLIYLEILVSLTDRDIKSLYHSFSNVEGFQYDDGRELYRDSKDTERLYELIPGASAICRNSRHYLDVSTEPCKFNINKFGMRDVLGKKRAKDKPKGVFRIIVLGGSNTFGVTVSNKETYPAFMEEYLAEKYPGKFEVWNAGLSAYVLSQKITYAKYLVKEFNPDLLIFQVANMGRRAFFYKGNLEYFFKLNKELFIENIPLLFTENKFIINIHRLLIKYFSSYRFLISTVNNYKIHIQENGPNVSDYSKMHEFKFEKYYHIYGDIVSQREYNKFINDEKIINRVRIVILNPWGIYKLEYDDKIPIIDLDTGKKPQEYSELHPPSYVYKWYAQKIIEELLGRDIIPRY